MRATTKQALAEGAKEFVRVVLLAVIPVAVAMLEQGNWNWKIVAVTAGIAALRAADKFVHENPSLKANGISPI